MKNMTAEFIEEMIQRQFTTADGEIVKPVFTWEGLSLNDALELERWCFRQTALKWGEGQKRRLKGASVFALSADEIANEICRALDRLQKLEKNSE